MKKLLILTMLLAFASTISIPNASACWPEPAEAVTFKDCLDGSFVIRCDCGQGKCAPSSQGFCGGASQ